MTAEPTTSPLVLRRLAASDDLGGALALMTGYVTEIRRKLFEGYGLKLEEATPDSDQLVAIAGLVEPPQRLYLAEVGGQAAGTCGLKEVAPGVAEIKRMFVDPALRGHGVARALLERVIADGRAAGYRTLQLETAVWMVEAHALYRSCGFADAPPFPDPEFGCFPGCDHLARYMTLTLTLRGTMTARSRSKFIDPAIAEYALDHSSGPDAVQLELQHTTAERTGQAAGMQIGDDQAVLLEILARATGARRAVEIGTFTGYSSLALARGMGPDGHLLCLDISEEWTNIARDAWNRAGVADRIDLRIGPALDTLRALPADESFDLAFVDADKAGYAAYYDELLPRLRPGGLLLVDNTLWSGAVLDDQDDSADTRAIRALNDRIAADPRVRVVLLPIGDGVTVVQKL